MKQFKTVLLVTAMIIAFAMNAFPQVAVIGQFKKQFKKQGTLTMAFSS